MIRVWRLSKTVLCEGLFIFAVLGASPSHSETYPVISTDSTGEGSLLWAVTQTQSHPGADTVAFNIPNSDAGFTGVYWRISLSTVLPTLTDGETLIDGTTQSANQGETNAHGPEIEIYGAACPKGIAALRIQSPGNILRDLAIGGFQATAVSMSGSNAVRNRISGCYVGAQADGVHILANSLNGVECLDGANHNLIGGLTAADRNVISGNGRYGIHLENCRCDTVLGNYLGVDATGMSALPNGAFPKDQRSAGIYVARNARRNIIGSGTLAGRNILSGNYRTGMRILGAGADSNIVRGNYMGLAADGSTALPNGEAGLVLGLSYLDSLSAGEGASYNVIGGDQLGEGNVISGNYSSGVQFARGCDGNVFKGNFVGSDADGERTVPNSHNGLYFYGNDFDGYPQNNVIGPNNLICGIGYDSSGSDWGCFSLNNAGTAFNTFFENSLGQNSSGSIQEGNNYGLLIQGGAHDNIFRNNVIAHNVFEGAYVRQAATINNRISQNRIFNNGLQAIHNVNGGNKALAPPVITGANAGSVEGVSLPGSTVEIYADPDGEAELYLGSVQASSDGTFRWEGSVPGMHVTALNIDEGGSTSELSSSFAVPVELFVFTAIAENSSTVYLAWCTLSESNNLGFAIERRIGNGEYERIAFVPGHGTTNSENNYGYRDAKLKPGKYTYRLKQRDADGTFSYSPTAEVQLAGPAWYALLENYPNPFNGSTRIALSIKTAGLAELDVYDLSGRRIRTLWRGQVEAGSYEFSWDSLDDSGNALPSGEYFIRLVSPEGRLVRKCLLLR